MKYVTFVTPELNEQEIKGLEEKIITSFIIKTVGSTMNCPRRRSGRKEVGLRG